jgi:cytochrome c oxidase subunit II
MTGGTVVVWAGVIALAIYAVLASPSDLRRDQARRLIYIGAAVPTAVLIILLVLGLSLLSDLTAPAPEHALRISVYGERWWWRFRYEPRNGQPFEVPNELRLPVGEPVEFRLASNNVIHSFWIPSLGGKIDMIPGRVNRLVLHPTRIGRFRGTCAEYCGAGHARMSFEAYVIDRSEFERWIEQQGAAAATSAAFREDAQ